MKSTRPVNAPATQRSAPTPVVQRPIPPFRALRQAIQAIVRQARPSKKLLILLASGAIVAIVTLVIFHHQTKSTNSVTPEYQTITPKGKTIDDLGGWKLISPPKSDPVFAYTDTIDAVPISTSEQPLPKSFIEDIDGQVSELAKKFNATTKLTAGSTTVYIGTSSKGPQSVIFTKNGLLILIKSEKVIKDASWTAYISSLQ